MHLVYNTSLKYSGNRNKLDAFELNFLLDYAKCIVQGSEYLLGGESSTVLCLSHNSFSLCAHFSLCVLVSIVL